MSYSTIITSDSTTRILNNNFLMFSNHMDFKRAANNLAQDKERSQNFGETSWEKSRLTLKCCDDSLRRRLRKCFRCSGPKGLRWTIGFVPFSKGHRPNLFRGMGSSDLGFSRFFFQPLQANSGTAFRFGHGCFLTNHFSVFLISHSFFRRVSYISRVKSLLDTSAKQ
jgi:hypothetical protein